MHKEDHCKHLLKVRFYHQTLPTSCLSSCFLMVCHYFLPEKYPLNVFQEKEFHRRLRFWREEDKYGELESMANFVRAVREEGFNALYYLEGPWGIPKGLETALWNKYLQNFLDVLEEEKRQGLALENTCKVKELLAQVATDSPVVAEVRFREFVTHAIILRGFSKSMVYVVDPLEGYQRILKKELERMLDLGYMKNAVAIKQGAIEK